MPLSTTLELPCLQPAHRDSGNDHLQPVHSIPHEVEPSMCACTGEVPGRAGPAMPGASRMPHEPLTLAPCHTLWPD